MKMKTIHLPRNGQLGTVKDVKNTWYHISKSVQTAKRDQMIKNLGDINILCKEDVNRNL
jgi:hypothetical protein